MAYIVIKPSEIPDQSVIDIINQVPTWKMLYEGRSLIERLARCQMTLCFEIPEKWIKD